MNNIEKLIEILKREVSSNSINKIKKLETIKDQINTYAFSDEKMIYELNSCLSDENKFKNEEVDFLLSFTKLSNQAKNYLLENCLKDSERKIFDSISKKIKDSIDFYKSEQEGTIDIKNLIRVLSGKKKKLIDENDLEFIIKIIKNQFNTIEQIDILNKINAINMEVYNNYKGNSDDSLELSEDDLEVTNIESEEVKNLLESYGINYSLFSDSEKVALSKHGVLDKMKGILDFLVKEGLQEEIKRLYSEIITKTLLYSSVKQLNQVKYTNNLDFAELVRTMPTILYPATRSKISAPKVNSGSNSTSATSGAMTNYIKNSELLRKNNISPEEIWNRCSTFFKQSYRANSDSIKCLDSYGISLYNADGNLKEIFSILGNRNPSIIDIYDAALEADAKDYALNNPSSIAPYQLYKFYMIKLARKYGMENRDIFGNYTMPDKKVFLRSKKIIENVNITADIENIFKEYGAVEIELPNRDIYDNLTKIADIIEISEEVLNDPNIKALDQFKQNDDLYNFNGVKISRRKVLRYYTLLKNNDKVIDITSIMYCILHRSMVDEEEFNNLYTLVKSVVSFEPDDNIKIVRKKEYSDESKVHSNPTIGGRKND